MIISIDIEKSIWPITQITMMKIFINSIIRRDVSQPDKDHLQTTYNKIILKDEIFNALK